MWGRLLVKPNHVVDFRWDSWTTSPVWKHQERSSKSNQQINDKDASENSGHMAKMGWKCEFWPSLPIFRNEAIFQKMTLTKLPSWGPTLKACAVCLSTKKRRPLTGCPGPSVKLPKLGKEIAKGPWANFCHLWPKKGSFCFHKNDPTEDGTGSVTSLRKVKPHKKPCLKTSEGIFHFHTWDKLHGICHHLAICICLKGSTQKSDRRGWLVMERRCWICRWTKLHEGYNIRPFLGLSGCRKREKTLPFCMGYEQEWIFLTILEQE